MNLAFVLVGLVDQTVKAGLVAELVDRMAKIDLSAALVGRKEMDLTMLAVQTATPQTMLVG
jgi:hypothetical protein